MFHIQIMIDRVQVVRSATVWFSSSKGAFFVGSHSCWIPGRIWNQGLARIFESSMSWQLTPPHLFFPFQPSAGQRLHERSRRLRARSSLGALAGRRSDLPPFRHADGGSGALAPSRVQPAACVVSVVTLPHRAAQYDRDRGCCRRSHGGGRFVADGAGAACTLTPR